MSIIRKMKDRPHIPLLVLLILSLGLQQFVLYSGGVMYGGDTSRYFNGSDRLLAGEPLANEQPAYIGYIVLVAGLRALGFGEVAVIEVQILVSGLALVMVYLAGREIAGVEAGLLAATLYGLNWDVQNWNLYILTDGLYISLLSLTTALAALAYSRKWRWLTALAVGAAIFTALLRPGGVVPLVVFAIFLLFALPKQWNRWQRIGTLLFVGLAVFLVFYFPTRTRMASIDPLDLITSGEVVWEVVEWRVDMPPIQTNNPGGLSGVVQYCLAYPMPCVNLFARRVGVYFGHMRAVYSLRHNLVIAALYYPMYVLAAVALWHHRKNRVMRLVAALIGAHVAFFALAVPSVDGRFFTYIVPLISMSAAVGLTIVWQWTRRKNKGSF